MEHTSSGALCRFADEELIAAAVRGDRRAFRVLWERHQAWIRRYVSGYARATEDLEDLVQDVCLKIHTSLPTYRPPSSFTRWAAMIARNAGIDSVRRRLVRLPPAGLCEADELDVPDSRYDPAAVLGSAVLKAELRDALGTLTPDQRHTIALRYFGFMSIKEVAAALQCPEGTVKSRLHASLVRLRSVLEQTPLHQEVSHG